MIFSIKYCGFVPWTFRASFTVRLAIFEWGLAVGIADETFRKVIRTSLPVIQCKQTKQNSTILDLTVVVTMQWLAANRAGSLLSLTELQSTLTERTHWWRTSHHSPFNWHGDYKNKAKWRILSQSQKKEDNDENKKSPLPGSRPSRLAKSREKKQFANRILSFCHHLICFDHLLCETFVQKTTKMSFFGKMFGGKKDTTMTTGEAIQNLRETENMLIKKQDFLEKKIEQEYDAARKHGKKNKRGECLVQCPRNVFPCRWFTLTVELETIRKDTKRITSE